MRIAQVIGRVTLSHQDPSYKGGRWLICNPLATRDFNTACSTAPAISNEASLVSYDSLGADDGAIDAITVAIFDSLQYSPPKP